MDWTAILENAPLAGVLLYMHVTGMKELRALIGELKAIVAEMQAMIPAKPAQAS